MDLEKVTLEEVALELSRTADRRFPYDPCRGFTILAEEVGEVAKEVLVLGRLTASPDQRTTCRLRAVTELIQVASVAVRLASRLKEGI